MRPAASRAETETEPICVALKAFEMRLRSIIKTHDPSVRMTCAMSSLTK